MFLADDHEAPSEHLRRTLLPLVSIFLRFGYEGKLMVIL